MSRERPGRRVPKSTDEVREKLDGVIGAFARGDISSWATPLGATLADAARWLGVLWNSTVAVPPDLRLAIAPHIGCAADDVSTYSRLVRRMMRALPAALAAGNAASGRGSSALLDDLLGHPNVVLSRASTHDGRGRRHVTPPATGRSRSS
jgi:hypothetical protein